MRYFYPLTHLVGGLATSGGSGASHKISNVFFTETKFPTGKQNIIFFTSNQHLNHFSGRDVCGGGDVRLVNPCLLQKIFLALRHVQCFHGCQPCVEDWNCLLRSNHLRLITSLPVSCLYSSTSIPLSCWFVRVVPTRLYLLLVCLASQLENSQCLYTKRQHRIPWNACSFVPRRFYAVDVWLGESQSSIAPILALCICARSIRTAVRFFCCQCDSSAAH